MDFMHQGRGSFTKDRPLKGSTVESSHLPFFHKNAQTFEMDLKSCLTDAARRETAARAPYLPMDAFRVNVEMGDAGFAISGVEIAFLGDVDKAAFVDIHPRFKALLSIPCEIMILPNSNEGGLATSLLIVMDSDKAAEEGVTATATFCDEIATQFAQDYEAILTKLCNKADWLLGGFTNN